MNDTLTVRLGQQLALALQEEVSRTGLSKSEIARQAIAAKLQQVGKNSVMKRYFGVMRGPSDLSTNKSCRRNSREVIPLIAPPGKS